VVAAIRRIGVSGCAHTKARRAAEFAHGNEQGIFEHAALRHVLDERGNPTVKNWAMEILGKRPVNRSS
jgi:hypothetical protein